MVVGYLRKMLLTIQRGILTKHKLLVNTKGEKAKSMKHECTSKEQQAGYIISFLSRRTCWVAMQNYMKISFLLHIEAW